ncbi:type II toxin-antitoxin system HicB family antitoxin [Lactobacillus ultunensis]|uniref:Toxin-antitoxin system, antitoxin component, HicB family n=1 Tax=Lactobacillus ultunensis DSM 16047 TaxID=525365 RepID=C2ELI4_9LACO|nr:type II toxin-antitoxin system HicB family antitoxin [Lactobacillus ultunensis]EEJ72632.1 toxin-antitoxin system, antitoxin component, HicB family [Lactobacillus ultunensis DSM 16047]KRL81228.1 putative phage protein [Lactobacillus ultunensis DSM 16047]QQP28173.1 type II toxin-antitoxin system HicB family antitoxin [Lactobacillus ultunensis]
MRTVVYPAVLDDSENGEKNYFTVEFPDVPGAFSEGHGLAEALYNAEQTLGLALYDVPEKDLPTPTSLDEVREFCKKNYPNAHVYPVATDLDAAAKEVKPVMVKKNTRIPGKLAQRAEAAGINFSETLKEALERKLAKN